MDFGLVIGIGDYPEYGTNGTLQGAVRDAEEFDRWLTNPIGGNVAPANRRFLPSSNPPLAPLRQQVEDALTSLHAQVKGAQAGRFYFYFSGHGHTERRWNVALCLPNWSPDIRRHAALDLQEYLEFITNCMGFSEIIAFLDCCRLRKPQAMAAQSELGCALPKPNAGGSRQLVMYGAEFQAAAFEDGQKDQVRGHFTSALLEGLWGGAAVEESGGISHMELLKYVEARVPKIAAASGHRQKAEILNGLSNLEPSVFGSLRNQDVVSRYRIRFDQARRGTILLEDMKLQVLREGPATDREWLVEAKPGWHTLREPATGFEKKVFFVPTLAEVRNVDF